MTKGLKRNIKIIAPAAFALLIAVNLAVPFGIANAASFGSGPFDIIEGYNFSDEGSGSHWQRNSTQASIGELIAVEVFIKNISGETAQNVRVKLSTNASGDSGTISATISADSAGSASGSFSVNLDGSGEINDLNHNGVTKLYDAFLHQKSYSGSAGDLVSGSGLLIGDVAPGDSNSRFIVAYFEVEGCDEPEPSDDLEVTAISHIANQHDATLVCGVEGTNNNDTNVWVEYGKDSSIDNLDNNSGTKNIDEDNNVTIHITGLDEGTRYYYRCVAENDEDSDASPIRSFITESDEPEPEGDAPEVTTESASNIDTDSAVLNCTVDANGDDTDAWFEWGETSSNLNNDTSEVSVDGDETNASISKTITGLDEDTEYYFRCVGENGEGTDAGSTRSFTTDEEEDDDDDDDNDTGGKPSVTTLSADDIDEDGARLRCEVDTNGDDADVWFEWGEDDDDLDEDTSEISVADDQTNKVVTKTITGLDEDTKYYFRCLIEDDGGEEDEGSVKSFTTDENGGDTDGDEPEVWTDPATAVTQTSAVLEGEVDANGEDTDVWFEWGTSSNNLSRDTSSEDVGDDDNVKFDSAITGLTTNTTYFYRAVAENSEGDDYGVIRSFRTGAPIVNVITRIVETIRPVQVVEEEEVKALIITLDADRTDVDEDSREIDYTVSYDNRTDETFTNAVLIVDLPRELNFVDADPSADDEDDDVLTFEIGTISPDEEDSFVITVEVDEDVDINDTIRFTADVEYTDSGTNKLVTVIDEHTFGELISGRTGTFTALLIDSLRNFFTSPILWLILLVLLVYFAVRYFVAGRDRRSAALV